MFAGCKRNVETPEQDNEPTATVLTTATPVASEEPDVFETPGAEETDGNGAIVKPDTTDEPEITEKATDIPGTAATEKSTDAPSKTIAPGTAATPDGGVEMPRVPLG